MVLPQEWWWILTLQEWVKFDAVDKKQDQDQEPQDLLDNAGNPEHEIAGVPQEENQEEIDIERPNI